MPRNPKVEFDHLQLYFGEPYVIDLESALGSITVYSPTIGDIVHIGEKKFYQTLQIFICNTTQYRLLLWELNIDWNEFSDFQLFCMLYKQIDPDVSKLIFGDLDFQKFEPMIKRIPKVVQEEQQEEDTSESEEIEEEPEYIEELILWDNEDEIEINADVHNHFSQYLREVFGTNPEEKITSDPTLKQWYITKDRRAADRVKELEAKGKEKSETSIQSIISSLVNHPGFKYKLSELREVGVAEFYDSVKRLQVYEQTTALLKGMYSGFIDSKNIKPQDYNFMRDI